jgi:mRNA-degrading endonuclease RelE of RelBE toxin-antitoxin system
MQILVTPSCERAIKKLHANQKKSLDKSIKAIATKPEIGDPKVGDLEGIYVYKFKLVDDLEYPEVVTKLETLKGSTNE